MATTIQISEELHRALSQRKLFDRETYEEVIWDLVEDSMELNEKTKNELAQARKQIKAGKTHTLAEVKNELGI